MISSQKLDSAQIFQNPFRMLAIFPFLLSFQNTTGVLWRDILPSMENG